VKVYQKSFKADQISTIEVKKKYIINDIVHADSKHLAQFIKPNSVALTITSPPYRNAINYTQHLKNIKAEKNFKYRGNVGGTLEEYLEEMEMIFDQVRRVTVKGGFCCIVIADELEGGTLTPLPSLLLSRVLNPNMPEEGWHLRDMIIWNKVTAGRSGAGNRFSQFVKTPIPTRYRANIMHEYVLVLQKGKESRDLPKDIKEKMPLNRAMKRQVALSVWDITPVPPNVIGHPAVFPEQIPWRLINLFSLPDDTVLDPMCGSGQTLKVAKNLKRNYIGVDIRKEYVSLAKKRLKEKLMLSNFMIPLYFPVKWSKAEQPGGKSEAYLDVEEQIPRGYKMIFQKISKDEEYGTKTTHIYYKNRRGEYLCCVIGAQENPYIIAIGDPKSSPVFKKFVKSLPQQFGLLEIKKSLPKEIPSDAYTAITVSDILEYEKMIERKSRTQRTIIYEKTVRS